MEKTQGAGIGGLRRKRGWTRCARTRTNEYNWEKMPDPPKFEPTKCHKCGKVINLAEGGYSSGKDGYTCSDCFDFKL